MFRAPGLSELHTPLSMVSGAETMGMSYIKYPTRPAQVLSVGLNAMATRDAKLTRRAFVHSGRSEPAHVLSKVHVLEFTYQLEIRTRAYVLFKVHCTRVYLSSLETATKRLRRVHHCLHHG